MDTVVILDHDSNGIEGYKRMLASCKDEIEYKFFQYPEEALEYIKNYPAAVLISELNMPIMSGKEVFEMVEMLSPFTVRIAMTQIDDVADTLEIFNKARIFKMILKPFFVVEDILKPVQEALEYYRIQEKEEKQRRKMEQELEVMNQNIQKLSEQLEQKRQKHEGIYQVAVGVIRGNLNSEIKGLDAGESAYASAACEELLQEFMRYYMYEEHSYQYHMEHTHNLFHHPEEGCVLQVQNKINDEIPSNVMSKIAYEMFLGGYLCQQLFRNYRTVMMIEKEGNVYVLRMFCQYPEKEDLFKIESEKVRSLIKNVIEEIAKSLADRLVSGVKAQQFAVKAYIKEGGHHE